MIAMRAGPELECLSHIPLRSDAPVGRSKEEKDRMECDYRYYAYVILLVISTRPLKKAFFTMH